MIDSKNIEKLFKNKRVCIVGDIMLDEYVYTHQQKKSTEYKHVHTSLVYEKKTYLGGAANVAHNIRKLGSTPYLVGVCGNDEQGKKLQDLLAKNKISNEYLIHTNIITTYKKRIFTSNKPNIRIDEEEIKKYPKLIETFIIHHVEKIITKQKPNALIFQDYNKGALTPKTIKEIIQLCICNNIPFFVDPKFENWSAYQHCTIFKPNLNEFNFYCNELNIKQKIKDSIVEIKKKVDAKNVLITLGKKGNIYINEEQKIILKKANKIIQHADVCGAGDSVIATICLAYLAKLNMNTIAELTNIAGSIACMHENIYAISINDIIDSFDKKL